VLLPVKPHIRFRRIRQGLFDVLERDGDLACLRAVDDRVQPLAERKRRSQQRQQLVVVDVEIASSSASDISLTTISAGCINEARPVAHRFARLFGQQ